jgi:lipopolysaccharide/colanic/teichoic acid biosynthesis glycosyltransferase
MQLIIEGNYFTRKSVGKDGEVFSIFKFRSMKNDSESNGAVFPNGDVRVTAFGKFMRKTRIDEFSIS